VARAGDAVNKDEKLIHCQGCRDNFYNGNNDLGVKECWLLKSAHLVMKKEVHISQVPPWKQSPREFLNCFRRPGHIYVRHDQEC
jgi:hypothetical protein